MAAKIEITRVALSPLPREEVRASPLTLREDWYLLEVALRNDSGRALHVVSDLRAIEYDEERRRLRLFFTESAEEPRGLAGVPPPAPTTAVGAGTEAVLSIRVASPITSAEFSEGGAQRLLEVRIDRDVDSVECAVAYGREAPPPSDLTALERPVGASAWPVVTDSIELG